ncbi:MAG: hypothetical protein Kow00109_29370 [Acidobacteriota bacterium]
MRGPAVRGSSVDPAAGDPARPWTLNRYAYAWNDLVNFLDPDGGEPRSLQCEDSITHTYAWLAERGFISGRETTCTYTARERGQGGGGGGPVGAPTGSGVGSRTPQPGEEGYSGAIGFAVNRALARLESNERCREALGGDSAVNLLREMWQQGRIRTPRTLREYRTIENVPAA